MDDPLTVTVVDIETTGLDYKLDRIIEIGAVKLVAGKARSEFHSLVDPGVSLRQSNVAIHGITDDMIRGCPRIESILPQFVDFLGNSPLVAHNVTFDFSFINFAAQQIWGRELELTLIDTMELAREVFPREKALSLERLLHLLDRPAENLHRALNDARALASIYPDLANRFDEKLRWHRERFGLAAALASRYVQINDLIEALREEEWEARRTLELYLQESGLESFRVPGGSSLKLNRRESWEFHHDDVKPVLAEVGILDRVLRVDRSKLDRFLKGDRLSSEQKAMILATRRSLGTRYQLSIERSLPGG